MKTPLTEADYCPLDGWPPMAAFWLNSIPRPWPDPVLGPDAILVPGKVLPPETTDAQAEHERAMMHAAGWSRREDGRVCVWVDM
jgi:hypothetical protein